MILKNQLEAEIGATKKTAGAAVDKLKLKVELPIVDE